MADQRPSRIKNLTYAVLAGQAGCASVVLILIALFAGMWLDHQFGLRGPFTIGLLLLSIPISLFALVQIAVGMVKQIPPPPPSRARKDTTAEEGDL
jgi:hypothetical protein